MCANNSSFRFSLCRSVGFASFCIFLVYGISNSTMGVMSGDFVFRFFIVHYANPVGTLEEEGARLLPKSLSDRPTSTKNKEQRAVFVNVLLTVTTPTVPRHCLGGKIYVYCTHVNTTW